MKLIQFLAYTILFFAIISCKNNEEKKVTFQGEQKIAYVDPEEIIPNMPEYLSAKAELDQLKSNLQSQLENEQRKAEQYYSSFTNKVQQGILSPAQQKSEEAKLMKMQEDLQKKAMVMEQDMIKKEEEMTKPMYDKFNAALKELAKAKGYSYVFDKKLLLYSEGGIDATSDLKQKLNLK
jgi:outer membrane protein